MVSEVVKSYMLIKLTLLLVQTLFLQRFKLTPRSKTPQVLCIVQEREKIFYKYFLYES